MTNTFSKNLKLHRQNREMTQENVADALGISAQAVSRWECGITCPDVMLLPEIARLYCVTIDELYRTPCTAYENYAQRVASVFEVTERSEDFLAAESEFKKQMKNTPLNMADKFNFAYVYHEMMKICKKKALALYDSAISEGREADQSTYDRCRDLRAEILIEMGQGDSLIEEQEENVKKNDKDYEWAFLMELYLRCGQYEKAYSCYIEAAEKFPTTWQIHCNGGHALMGLKKYEQAIEIFDLTESLNPYFNEGIEGKAHCYEEIGDFDEAIRCLKVLIEKYYEKGYVEEIRIFERYLQELELKKKQS